MRTLLSLLIFTATPALAGPSLDAQVVLVKPNQSGRVAPELKSMKRALEGKGYSGASVQTRRSVHLEAKETTHVHMGRTNVDLTLLSVHDGKAKVRFQQHGHASRVTTVSTTNTRFFVVSPKG